MNKPNNKKAIDKIVSRVRNDSYFLGKMLSEYEAIHGINDQQLAHYLECELDKIGRLFLCRVPNDSDQQFQKDVARIADFANCNGNKLITILREIQGLIALRGEVSNDSSSGLLMAARDRHAEGNDNKDDVSSKPEKDENARKKKE